MAIENYLTKGAMYVGEGLASLAVAVNVAQAISGVSEQALELIQRGAVNMLFYGAVIAFCSQYRQAVNSRHSLEAVLDTLDSCSQSYQN